VGDLARTKPLSAGDARQLAEQLATLTGSGLPLAQGLRAAAAEYPSRHLRRAMDTLAGQLESGRSLDDILASDPRFLPQHVQQLLIAGSRAGNLPDVFVRLVEIDHLSADLRRSVRQATAYPLLLLALWGALVIAFGVWFVPDLAELLKSFHAQLPWATRLLFWISWPRVLRGVAFLTAAVPMLVYGLRVSLKAQSWQRLLAAIPLFGPTIVWRGVANWARLLALVLRQNIPMPDACKLAATGVDTSLMAIDGLRVARMTAHGRNLADAIADVHSIPASIVPLVRWGQEHSALAESLDTAAEMFEDRVRFRGALMEAVLPPLVFIAVAAGAVWLFNAILFPIYAFIDSALFWQISGMSWVRKSGPMTSQLIVEFLTEYVWVVGVAVAVWLAVSLVRWSQRTALGLVFGELSGAGGGERPAWMCAILAVFDSAYWLFTFIVLFLVLVEFAGALGILLWLVVLVIGLVCRIRYGKMERRSLLWLLAVAVEKGFPLAPAARAFANERDDKLGRRARRLAMNLEAGRELDSALADSGIRLPDEVLVAVRTGERRGGLAALLKHAVELAGQLDAPLHAVAARLIYLAVLLLSGGGIVAFVAISIVPAFVKIFDDFKTTLPPFTRSFIQVEHIIVALFPLAAIGLACVIALLLLALAAYAGVYTWRPPLVRRMTMLLDEALILRVLAQAVDRQDSLSNAVAALAEQYPKTSVRDRLREASVQIGQGSDWRESLERSGLLPAAEAGILKAAQRAGNLAWAMNEMADRLTRKLSTRLASCLSVGFPTVMIVFGLLVGWFAVAMLCPLAKLIIDLSSTR